MQTGFKPSTAYALSTLPQRAHIRKTVQRKAVTLAESNGLAVCFVFNFHRGLYFGGTFQLHMLQGNICNLFNIGKHRRETTKYLRKGKREEY